jgi:hypothetical protein
MEVRASGGHWSKGRFRDRDWTGETNGVFSDEEPTLSCSMSCGSQSRVNLWSVLSVGHGLNAKNQKAMRFRPGKMANRVQNG